MCESVGCSVRWSRRVAYHNNARVCVQYKIMSHEGRCNQAKAAVTQCIQLHWGMVVARQLADGSAGAKGPHLTRGGEYHGVSLAAGDAVYAAVGKGSKAARAWHRSGVFKTQLAVPDSRRGDERSG